MDDLGVPLFQETSKRVFFGIYGPCGHLNMEISPKKHCTRCMNCTCLIELDGSHLIFSCTCYLCLPSIICLLWFTYIYIIYMFTLSSAVLRKDLRNRGRSTTEFEFACSTMVTFCFRRMNGLCLRLESPPAIKQEVLQE